jgi:hypothetical protein
MDERQLTLINKQFQKIHYLFEKLDQRLRELDKLLRNETPPVKAKTAIYEKSILVNFN